MNISSYDGRCPMCYDHHEPHCNIKPKVGDTIITNIGNKYIVGEIVEEGSRKWVVPEGAHEYTYWIPFENIVKVLSV